MTYAALTLPLVLLVVAMLLALVRVARGPTIYDRIMAFDALVVCAAGVVALLSLAWHTTVFLELILIVSSLGFFSTVAFAYYLDRARPPASVRRRRQRQPSRT